MLNIAVCDDERSELELLCKHLDSCLGELGETYTMSRFSSGFDLISHVAEKGAFSIIFLDIVMSGLNGIETAKELRHYSSDCPVIFTTTSQEFAVSSYTVDALHYLLKPITRRDLEAALGKALGKIYSQDRGMLSVKTSDGMYNLRYNRIMYIESSGHKVNVILDGSAPISVYARLDDFATYTAHDSRFIRIHKSYIVNADYIFYFGSDAVELANKHPLRVSRALAVVAKQKYMAHLFARDSKA